MKSPEITFRENRQSSLTTRSGESYNFRGVLFEDRMWGDIRLKPPDKYVARRPVKAERFISGNIVQLEIKGDIKSYVYKVSKIIRGSQTEYHFRPCYKSAREPFIIKPDELHKFDSYYYGTQEEINSNELRIYPVADEYLLPELGYSEYLVSSTI